MLVAVTAIFATLFLAIAGPSPAGAQPQVTTPDAATTTTSAPPVTAAPAADVRLGGSVEESPPAQGIGTGDTIGYRLSVQNQGPDPVPAGGLLLVLSVGAEGGGLATMEVARFNDGGLLQPAQGGACGIGTRQLIQCTNRQQLEPGQEIGLVIAHRHPAPVAGSLSLSAEASIVSASVSDPDAGNNRYGGPTYRFTIQPSPTTTMPTTTTTVDPSSTSSSDPDSSSTTTTLESTTTLPPTTTITTLPPTTTTALEAMTDDDATLVGSQATLVAPADGSAQTDDDQELLLAPSAEEPGDGDGPPLVLLGALGALVLLAGGVALALYLHLNQAPPIVDIRRFE
jgi:hypothetical protein